MSARAMRLAEVLRSDWTVLARRKDVAILHDLVVFVGRGSHCANPAGQIGRRRRGRWRAAATPLCGSPPPIRLAERSVDHPTRRPDQRCAAYLMVATPFSSSCFGRLGFWSRLRTVNS